MPSSTTMHRFSTLLNGEATDLSVFWFCVCVCAYFIISSLKLKVVYPTIKTIIIIIKGIRSTSVVLTLRMGENDGKYRRIEWARSNICQEVQKLTFSSPLESICSERVNWYDWYPIAKLSFVFHITLLNIHVNSFPFQIFFHRHWPAIDLNQCFFLSWIFRSFFLCFFFL